MKDYNVEFDYNIRTGGAMTFQAETRSEADDMAREYVSETYPDAFDIEVVEVEEINK